MSADGADGPVANSNAAGAANGTGTGAASGTGAAAGPGDPMLSLHARSPGSAKVTIEDVGRSKAVVIRIDDPATKGALLPEDGEKITSAAQMALDKGIPLVGYIASAGAHIPSGIGAVFGWGTAAKALVACSGVVPIVFCGLGPVVSGPALLFGIADFTVMLPQSYAFVSGPAMVELFTGVPIDADTLGGSDIHRSETGAAGFLAADQEQAEALVAELLGLLPSNNQELPPQVASGDDPARTLEEAQSLLPESASGGYDMKQLLAAVADDGYLLEVRQWWAPNMITALGSVGGCVVGFVANQPQVLAGTLNIAASQKAARFVRFCDSFNIPIVTFVDTPGFQPGKDLEWRGMIRHGAQLVFAYAEATVPRINVTVRKSYGGAYIVMDSKRMGNDIALSWPSAEIAVMGARGAVGILHRKETEERRLELEEEYAEKYLTPYIAAERGSIDRVIDPADTRREIAVALRTLMTKRESLPRRSHDNSPL